MNKKMLLARRLREIRLALYGEDGVDILARALHVPPQTWCNYERGVTMPAEVLIGFLEVTGADVQSLLTSEIDRPRILIN